MLPTKGSLSYWKSQERKMDSPGAGLGHSRVQSLLVSLF